MPVSEKQLAANRANAAKSTGAKTAQGKLNSSRNAVRHGLRSNIVVLESESADRFQALMASFENEFNPQTPTEQALVENMAVARWRTLRLWSMETAGMSHQIRQHEAANIGEDAPTRAALALSAAGDTSHHRELISRYETRFDRQFHRAAQRLTEMRAERNRQEKSQATNDPIDNTETTGHPE